MLLAACCLLLIACGGSSKSSAAAPDPTATATPDLSPTVEPTAPTGTVRATISSSCKLLDSGAELTVPYGATTNGGLRLSQMRLYLNGKVIEDSGPIDTGVYIRTAHITVGAGSSHTLVIVADTNSKRAGRVSSLITCPKAPAGPRA